MFNKYIVMTAVEMQDFAVTYLAPDPILPSIGKRMSDIYGKRKRGKTPIVYNTDYNYSVKEYDDALITNPDHADFGKYAVNVSDVDVATLTTGLADRMVDNDSTWRI